MDGYLKVLVVEDEEPLAKVVAAYIHRENFLVDIAHNGPGAVELAKKIKPDLVVLDVMLPGFDGLEVCRQLRTFTDCYIIMLTARSDEIDKVVGLSVGADDYLVKPFSPRELIARIQAMLRRPRTNVENPTQSLLTFLDLSVNTLSRKVTCDNNKIKLTKTEFDLLYALITAPNRVYSRRELIDMVWGEKWYGDEHIVDVHIGHLRKSLNDNADVPKYIRTVRGIGYATVETTNE